MADELTVTSYGHLDKPEQAALGLTVGTLEHLLEQRFPRAYAEPWDTYGLTVGDPDKPVRHVAIALDATLSNVRRAHALGAEVLVTHHPPFLEAPSRIVPGKDAGAGRVLWEAARQGVAIMSFHTALDATDAAGRMIPEMLSLEAAEVFEQKPGLTDNGVPAGYGRVCTPAENERLSVGLLASRCTAVFGIQPRVWGSFTDRLEHILTWGGSLGSPEDYAALCRMDAIVCGEVKYHLALDLSEAGVSVIELGHDVSELPLTLVLARSVRDCGIDQQRIMVLDRGPHWAYPETIRI